MPEVRFEEAASLAVISLAKEVGFPNGDVGEIGVVREKRTAGQDNNNEQGWLQTQEARYGESLAECMERGRRPQLEKGETAHG
jgi:hypothetical protein